MFRSPDSESSLPPDAANDDAPGSRVDGPGDLPAAFAGVLVPALAIGVPLLLVVAVVLVQIFGGVAMLPAVRRTLGSLGLGRLSRGDPSAAATHGERPARRPSGG